MKLFIRAEWLGDWKMHLTATKSILNFFFAATGHFNYAKNARIYLQQMLNALDSYQEHLKLFFFAATGHFNYAKNARLYL